MYIPSDRAHNVIVANVKNKNTVEGNCLDLRLQCTQNLITSIPVAYSSTVLPLTIHLFQNRYLGHYMQVVEIPHLRPTLICIQRCQHQNIQDSATQIFMWFNSEMSTSDLCASLCKKYRPRGKKTQHYYFYINTPLLLQMEIH